MKPLKKKITKTLMVVFRILVMVYLFFGGFLFVSQKALIYHPDNQDFEGCYGFQDYEKINYQGTRFYYKAGTSSDVLVYYHGNAGSACDRSQIKSLFETSDKHLIFVEYAGYSNDHQSPSQKLILQDVRNIHQYIKEANFENITIYGQSIGSGAASYHAYLGNTDQLILITPFDSLTELAQSKYKIYPAWLILREKYDNQTWLQNYQNQLLIIHGDQDRLIPHSFSEALFESIPSAEKEYILIPNRGHNDLWNEKQFEAGVLELIS